MKTKLLCVIAAAAFSSLAAGPAQAEESRKPEAQHEDKTRTAEAEAARKAPAEKAPVHQSQQEKMKTCNVEAGKKNLHGDERRAFMSSCLKG